MGEFTANEKTRLDVFLTAESKAHSRSHVNKLIKSDCVKINGITVNKPSYLLKAGDTVTVSEEKAGRKTGGIIAADLDLEILYEDDFCIVINKPAGISVHPANTIAKEEKTILSGVAFLFEKRNIAFSPDAVLVHRLDKETTGCLLIAKTPEAHAFLQKQFESRTVKKTYLAIASGVPGNASAVIDAPIGRSILNRTAMSLFRTGKSRGAQTSYRTVSSSDKASLLECELHTGRTHQIRVHLSSIGNPILGDKTYKTSRSEELSQKFGITNLCLHSRKLIFSSIGNDLVEVLAPLPVSFLSALKSAGLKLA